MAQIPMGQFAQPTVLPKAQGRGVDTSPLNNAGEGAAAIGRGLNDLAQGVEAIHQRNMEQNSQLAAIKASNAITDYETQVEGARQSFLDRIKTGAVDYNVAGSEWETALKDIPPPQLPPGADKLLAERFNGGLRQVQQRASLTITGAADGARRDDMMGQVVKGEDGQLTLLSTSGDTTAALAWNDAANASRRAAGLDEARTADAHQRFAQKVYGVEVKTRYTGHADDIGQLQGLLTDLTAKDGRYIDKIDPDARLAYVSSVQTRIAQIQNAQQTAIDKREANAKSVVNDVWGQAETPIPPTPDQVQAWASAVQGTSYEGAFRDAIGGVQETQALRNMPDAAQSAWLADREAALNKGGTADEWARYQRQKAIVATDQETREKRPLEYLQQRTGIAPAAFDPKALLTGDYASVGRAFQDRFNSIAALQRQGYNVKPNLLTDSEQQQIVGVMNQMPPEKLLELYAPLRLASGSDKVYQAVMTQIGQGAPLKAYAGQIASYKGGYDTARLILKGDALLSGADGNKVTMPPDKAFREEFASVVGNAYQGSGNFERDYRAAVAVYAASAAQDGDSQAGVEFNQQRFDHAIGAAVGNIVDIGGVQTQAPFGMDSDAFENKAEPMMRDALKVAGLDPDASGVGLMSTGKPGRYVLVQGRIPLMNPQVQGPNGQAIPLFIDFEPPVPVNAAPKAKASTQPQLADPAVRDVPGWIGRSH